MQLAIPLRHFQTGTIRAEIAFKEYVRIIFGHMFGVRFFADFVITDFIDFEPYKGLLANMRIWYINSCHFNHIAA